MIVYYFIY